MYSTKQRNATTRKEVPMAVLTEDEQKILEVIKEALPDMTEAQRAYLLGAGEAVIMIKAAKPDQEENQPA
jgi:hypothetical protein